MIRQFSRRAGLLALTLLALTAVTGRVNAQFNAPKFLKTTVLAPAMVTPGKAFDLAVTLTVASPYHVQANPATEGYIPTEVKIGTVKGLVMSKTAYPKGMEVKISGDKLSIYEGTIKVMVTITPDKTLKPGRVTLPLTIHYQGCNETACYPPTDMQTTVALTIGKYAAPKKMASR